MTLEIAYGHDAQIRHWVANQLGIEKLGGDKFAALGVVRDNELVGGAVYHEYRPHIIEISLATVDKRWCSRPVLKQLFGYPFIQLGVVRLQATCAKKNKSIRRLMEKLGFKLEGCARKAYDGKQDAMIYSMLNTECRWL